MFGFQFFMFLKNIINTKTHIFKEQQNSVFYVFKYHFLKQFLQENKQPLHFFQFLMKLVEINFYQTWHIKVIRLHHEYPEEYTN